MRELDEIEQTALGKFRVLEERHRQACAISRDVQNRRLDALMALRKVEGVLELQLRQRENSGRDANPALIAEVKEARTKFEQLDASAKAASEKSQRLGALVEACRTELKARGIPTEEPGVKPHPDSDLGLGYQAPLRNQYTPMRQSEQQIQREDSISV